MTLEILDCSGLVTIQDSGRLGWRQFGVPVSGPMDAFAFQAANALVGNSEGQAALEIGLGDLTLRARQDCVIAVAGLGFGLSIYIWEFPLWSSYYVRAGWTIRLARLGMGMWVYLAVAGGVLTPPVLGSAATNLRGGFGGLGRRLQAGDMLRAGSPAQSLLQLAARTLPESARPVYGETPGIEVIPGPQARQFTEASRSAFTAGAYKVSTTSDRMGYRLEGPALALRLPTDLISEGMTTGTIQVPPGGQPIVMMADSPTTGGYPKIASVVSADLPVLAQCLPGRSRIRFRETTVVRAQKRYREMMSGLDMIEEE